MGLSARLLVQDDKEQAQAFLKPHTPFAFFLRSNLAKVDMRYEGKPYQADFFGAFDSGKLVGIIAHGWIGNVQVFAPTPQTIPLLAQALREYRKEYPRMIECFLGPAAQVEALLSACGIKRSVSGDTESKDSNFALALRDMIVPALLQKSKISVRRAVLTDIDLLSSWRHDFYVESRGFAQGQATHDKAKTEMTRRVGEGDIFILEDGGERVSFCGVGGFLSDWTHVGPVWTPPVKRGLGYARAVTAGALMTLRNDGLTDACLFAGRPDAIRAYLAIGFKRVGDWLLKDLPKPIAQL